MGNCYIGGSPSQNSVRIEYTLLARAAPGGIDPSVRRGVVASFVCLSPSPERPTPQAQRGLARSFQKPLLDSFLSFRVMVTPLAGQTEWQGIINGKAIAKHSTFPYRLRSHGHSELEDVRGC